MFWIVALSARRADATPTFGRRAREKFLRVIAAWPNSCTFNEYSNDITFTVNCLDDARHSRIVSENLAQPADAHVDAAIERAGVASTRELDEFVARHHAVAVREQRCEHAIF
jgi:hypothetical protein